jgi:hypothetical protein
MNRMHERLRAAAAVSVAAVLAAACGASPGSRGRPAASPAASHSHARGTGEAATAARDRYRARCTPSQLRLTAGPGVSEATQQHTVILVLRNVSARGCTLQGYPAITLTAGNGKNLSFTYRRQGDQMLTSEPPAPVPLPPGAAAYVALNKNACIAFSRAVARQIRLTPPDARQPLTITLPDGRLDYCGPGDPGHTIDVIPVQPTRADVYAQALHAPGAH